MNDGESSCLDKRVAGEVGDGAHVDSSLHLHVAFLSPIFSPRVLDDPVVGGVADNEDSVVDKVFVNPVWVAFAVFIDPRGVVPEIIIGIDGDGDGANGGHCFGKGIFISFWKVYVSLVSGTDSLVAEKASWLLHALIRVALLSVDAVIVLDIFEGSVKEATVTAVVSI